MVFINFNNNIKNITLPNSINEFNTLITETYYNISVFYLIENTKLVTSKNYKNINKDNTIRIYSRINSRINGGILDILEPILHLF
mgnify:CR=1 FL=1